MTTLTVGELFAGIGGFGLGFDRAGCKTVWACEKDKNCQSAYTRHWPGVTLYDDVTELQPGELIPVDILCGGWPCQDLSLAGLRAGLAGGRSGLFFEFIRIADAIAPRWLVGENVPGMLSSQRGEDFATVLEWVTGFRPAVPANGWRNSGVCTGPKRTAAWRVLDAQYFGVAQRRRRVFIVGYAHTLGRPLGTENVLNHNSLSGLAAKVLFERESLSGNTPPRREAGARVARSLANSSVSSGYRYDPNGEEGRGHGVPSVFVAGNDGVVGLQMNFIRRPRVGDYVGTLAAQPGDAQFNGVWDMRYGVRRLTPVECERLQGFPDDWTAFSANGAPISDSARYRMLGNAVCVNVAEWIAKRIVAAERGEL